MICSVVLTILIFGQHANGLSLFDLSTADDTDNPNIFDCPLGVKNLILGLPNESLSYLLSSLICIL